MLPNKETGANVALPLPGTGLLVFLFPLDRAVVRLCNILLLLSLKMNLFYLLIRTLKTKTFLIRAIVNKVIKDVITAKNIKKGFNLLLN